ncbi:unnamed protein product [Heligmosomoides polygyrus]|uniref:Secreted protein n=1 Tax=Heligmosomoides polygyrus TaxID=6339 RepID=A0A183GGD1_HELPZ|nr:unnamed protein product [Heligmosomoides polygyrus]
MQRVQRSSLLRIWALTQYGISVRHTAVPCDPWQRAQVGRDLFVVGREAVGGGGEGVGGLTGRLAEMVANWNVSFGYGHREVFTGEESSSS